MVIAYTETRAVAVRVSVQCTPADAIVAVQAIVPGFSSSASLLTPTATGIRCLVSTDSLEGVVVALERSADAFPVVLGLPGGGVAHLVATPWMTTRALSQQIVYAKLGHQGVELTKLLFRGRVLLQTERLDVADVVANSLVVLAPEDDTPSVVGTTPTTRAGKRVTTPTCTTYPIRYMPDSVVIRSGKCLQDGLNVQGRCQTPTCALHTLENDVCVPLSFGTFDMTNVAHTVSCPECGNTLSHLQFLTVTGTVFSARLARGITSRPGHRVAGGVVPREQCVVLSRPSQWRRMIIYARPL